MFHLEPTPISLKVIGYILVENEPRIKEGEGWGLKNLIFAHEVKNVSFLDIFLYLKLKEI